MSPGRGGLAIGAVVAERYEVRFTTVEGPVYVDHRVFDREVEVELALWRMDPVLFGGDAYVEFGRAAREMRGVVHANLRRLFEVGMDEDGAPYLTSQLGSTEGISLRLGSGRTASEIDILRYANAMAEGLEAAHAAGRIHGRLAPVDLVEVAGIIKVSGAGLYHALDVVDPALAAERWGDASRYVAPEVRETGRGDRRADVFSMAAILCELASGVSRPDLAEATESLAGDHLALADLLARALSRAPERRPERPAELVERIRRRFVDERVPTMKRPVLIPPEARPTSKSRALARELDTSGPSGAADEGEGATVEESSPLFLDPSAAPLSPLFGPNQPTLSEGRAPSNLPPPAASARAPSPPPHPPHLPDLADPARRSPSPPDEPLVLPLHSRRPPDQPRAQVTPIIPAIDRPEMQPVLRPLSDLRQPAPASLGHYAPPRAPELFSAPPTRRRLLLVIGLSAAVLLAAIALTLAPWQGDEPPTTAATAPPGRSPTRSPSPSPSATRSPSPSPSPSARAGAPSPPTPSGPCPTAMALVAGDLLDHTREPYCIDRHEWPGAGEPPQLGATYEEAASLCEQRGARLCQPDEWEDACRGPGRSSFPYGGKYVDQKCNARGGEIAAAGSFPECQSAAGAFDMSGNAAEWDSSGAVRGASAVDGTRGRCSEPRRGGKPRIRAEDRADLGFRCCADPLAQVTPTR